MSSTLPYHLFKESVESMTIPSQGGRQRRLNSSPISMLDLSLGSNCLALMKIIRYLQKQRNNLNLDLFVNYLLPLHTRAQDNLNVSISLMRHRISLRNAVGLSYKLPGSGCNHRNSKSSQQIVQQFWTDLLFRHKFKVWNALWLICNAYEQIH
jgi:hypothetical protein